MLGVIEINLYSNRCVYKIWTFQELDEKIDTTVMSVPLNMKLQPGHISLAYHEDWKQRETAGVALPKDKISLAAPLKFTN